MPRGGCVLIPALATPLALPAARLLQALAVCSLTLKRPATDQARFVESFRKARLDANPHQVAAASFALERLERGGALLCDEVGLGKTIEAGLVLAQLASSGRGHVLIVVPVPLARQWQAELAGLFGVEARILGAQIPPEGLARGVWIVGRERAAVGRGQAAVRAAGPWDLVVIDEAHEVFGSLYRRYGKADGVAHADATKGPARRAQALKESIQGAPVLALTATPLQNNLLELWSLVHLVDRDHRVLGPRPEFARLFTVREGRALRPETEPALRDRLREVVFRTLRRDAQPFLEVPFVARRCETINFHLAPRERELYDELTKWLNEAIAAIPKGRRRLIALMLRKRMGSSVPALVSTLARIRQRLSDPDPPDEAGALAAATPAEIAADLATVAHLDQLGRAAASGTCPKLDALAELIERIRQRQLAGVASDKVVVFTESLRTLEAIVADLERRGLAGQITAFSGKIDPSRSQPAEARWEDEVGSRLPADQRPEGGARTRAALVHEFKTRTRVLVSTEAGAKGLNLQFCNCVVNFDLPWNPQRIEQRIGRVHRYGQAHDVVVVNFVNLDNEGEQRVYELLRDKLQLFEGLFGASDPVLGTVASILDFEARVEDLLLSCRTADERKKEFDRLALDIDAEERRQREQVREQAKLLIEGFDEQVKERFRRHADALPEALNRRDQTLLELLRLEGAQVEPGRPGNGTSLIWNGQRYLLGRPGETGDEGRTLTLDLPELDGLLRRVGTETTGRAFVIDGHPAQWWVFLVALRGLEEEEAILVLGPDGEAGLRRALADASRLEEAPGPGPESYPEDALRAGIDALKKRVRDRQEPRLRELLRLVDLRRKDTQRCLAEEEAELAAKAEEARRRSTRAKTAQESEAASREAHRLTGALAALQADRAARAARLVEDASREESKYIGYRAVRSSPKLVLAVCSQEGGP